MRAVYLLALALAATGCPATDSAPRYEEAGLIRYRKHTRSPDAAARPSGCNIIGAKYRVLPPGDRKFEEDTAWQTGKFSFCQLPAAWREALGVARVGEDIEFLVPQSMVPDRITSVLRLNLVGDLHAMFRIDTIEPHPAGLKFPLLKEPPEEAHALADGTRYLVIAESNGGKKADENDSIELQHSMWEADGTLLGSSLLHGPPTMVSVADTESPLKEILIGRGESERFLVWFPVRDETAVGARLLDATVVRIVARSDGVQGDKTSGKR